MTKLLLSLMIPLSLFATSAIAQAPPDWNCIPTYFGTDDGCDCGCGVADPDCETPDIGACISNRCDGARGDVDPADTTVCNYDPSTCGDGTGEGAEECDDGNTAVGDGCSADCLTVEAGFECPSSGACAPIVCGDGSVDGAEVCDDENILAGDGCAVDCLSVEAGFDCPSFGGACEAVVCGDDTTNGDEECDDGNTAAGDGCDANCEIETPAGWLCTPSYANDGGCDCGCGAIDPDCAEAVPVAAGCDDACCAFPDANGDRPFGCEYNWQPNDAGDGQSGCVAGGEGEGEGEPAGEGEGEPAGEGEGEDPPSAGEGEGETGGGCASDRRAADGAPFALVGIVGALLISRRRR
jgi:cysteine-rich repeat protein